MCQYEPTVAAPTQLASYDVLNLTVPAGTRNA